MSRVARTLESYRGEFPILEDKTYLCSHSLGAVPRATAEALAEYYDAWARLGIQAWEGPWWGAVENFSQQIETLLRAPSGSVVPMQNATRAMAAVASCLDYSGPRRKIVMTDLEFTTFYPFWRGQERAGAEIVLVESEDRMTVPAEEIVERIDRHTLLVATCHVYFRSGAVQDLAALARAARDQGAWMLGDGYQAVGTLPIDIEKLGVDFYVGGSHKFLCGGAGAGFLYVRPERLDELKPRTTGWFGLKNPFGYVKDVRGGEPHPGVYRFLDGTPNVPALYSAREGIRLVNEVGPERIRKHSLGLTGEIMKRGDELGLEVRTPRPAAARGGMVCLEFAGSQAATNGLVRNGVVVDWRPECGLRVSPHYYNTRADVDAFFAALAGARGGTAPRRNGAKAKRSKAKTAAA